MAPITSVLARWPGRTQPISLVARYCVRRRDGSIVGHIMNQPIEADIERVLFTPDQIKAAVHRIAGEILNTYQDKPLSMIAVLTGSLMFLSDLVRLLPIRLHLDCIGASSYGDRTSSAGVITITKQL